MQILKNNPFPLKGTQGKAKIFLKPNCESQREKKEEGQVGVVEEDRGFLDLPCNFDSNLP